MYPSFWTSHFVDMHNDIGNRSITKPVVQVNVLIYVAVRSVQHYVHTRHRVQIHHVDTTC